VREAFSDKDFILDSNGKVAGICLGYDYCAEHEWGVAGIKEALGIWSGDPKTEKRIMGFDRVRVTNADSVYFFEHETKFLKPGNKRPSKAPVYAIVLVQRSSWRSAEDQLKYARDFIDNHTFEFKRAEFNAAWNEKEFMIWGPEAAKEKLETIFQAFKAKDILLGMHRTSNPFAGNGLVFAMESTYPADAKEAVIREQKSYRKMWERINKTRILEKLKKAGCSYFACSPKQIQFESIVNEDKYEKPVVERQKASKLPDIMFWLNPMEQRKNNSGWFTVEELEQWTKGKGPIPMKET
jgi:hypothetical protein